MSVVLRPEGALEVHNRAWLSAPARGTLQVSFAGEERERAPLVYTVAALPRARAAFSAEPRVLLDAALRRRGAPSGALAVAPLHTVSCSGTGHAELWEAAELHSPDALRVVCRGAAELHLYGLAVDHLDAALSGCARLHLHDCDVRVLSLRMRQTSGLTCSRLPRELLSFARAHTALFTLDDAALAADLNARRKHAWRAAAAPAAEEPPARGRKRARAEADPPAAPRAAARAPKRTRVH